MNRNHLAIFHAVAEAGGISRGAEALQVSQPAVSKQVAELETQLGVRLLDRLPRRTQLTQAGAILADYARRIAILEQEAERAIQEYRGLRRGRLAVGASTTIGIYLLPEIVGEFHRRYPQVELQLEIANTRMIQQSLMENTLDLGLTEGLVETADLESHVFHRDELVSIAPPGHALLAKTRVTAQALCKEPFVMREKGSGTRAVVERALAQKDLSVQPIMSLGSTEAIKRAVAAGIGIAIVSRLSIDAELNAGRLAIIPVADLPIRRPLHLQKLRGKEEGCLVREFLSIVQARSGQIAGS